MLATDGTFSSTMANYNLSTRRVKLQAWGEEFSNYIEIRRERTHAIENAALVLTNDIALVDAQVVEVFSKMFPTDISQRPSSADMESLTLELQQLENTRVKLTQLKMEADVYTMAAPC